MWWNIMIPGRTNFFSKETHGHSSLCGFGQCGSVPNSLSMWNVPTTFSFWTWKAKTWRVRFHQSAHLPHCLFFPLSSVKPPRWGSWEESHEEGYHQIEPLLRAFHSTLLLCGMYSLIKQYWAPPLCPGLCLSLGRAQRWEKHRPSPHSF